MPDIFNLFKLIDSSNNKPGAIEYLVVGLGNPGKKYDKTRHNAGFMAIDYIKDKLCVKAEKQKFNALVSEATISGKRVLLLKPQTFMNLSGQSLEEACDFYKISIENVIVIYDDISLEPGKIRIRRKGSAGGHNGIKSIISSLGGENFPRIKIGVGKKPNKDYDLASWVLSTFSKDDMEGISCSLDKVYESLKLILEDNYEKAMNLYNS